MFNNNNILDQSQNKMRKLYFLVPGTDENFFCGGLFAELKILNLAKHICHSELVTYRQREVDKLFLDDILRQDTKNIIFVDRTRPHYRSSGGTIEKHEIH